MINTKHFLLARSKMLKIIDEHSKAIEHLNVHSNTLIELLKSDNYPASTFRYSQKTCLLYIMENGSNTTIGHLDIITLKFVTYNEQMNPSRQKHIDYIKTRIQPLFYNNLTT